jgi:hypothetical protein
MNIRKSSENDLNGFAELVRSGQGGSVHVLNKPYWAGEHTFTHCANQVQNERGKFCDLWAVDIYTRKGIDPIKHSKRVFIWADSETGAVNEATRFADEGITVLVTHIKPLEDRLREPANF